MKILSLKDWLELELPLIDLREKVSKPLYVKNRVVVHLPFSSLVSGERSCELPPRSTEFAILVEEDKEKNYFESFFSATISKATQQSRKAWNVVAVILADEEFCNQARDMSRKAENQVVSIFPSPRLWQPDPMLPTILWPELKRLLLEKTQQENQFEIWDLGCGAGRDVCYLAEQMESLDDDSIKNVLIVGIDNHKGSARRCEPLWKNRNVSQRAKTFNLNLNKLATVQQHIGSHVLCLYAVRFLNRKLVSYIANECDNFLSGTIFAMSHFCKPFQGAPWEFSHPKVSNFPIFAL